MKSILVVAAVPVGELLLDDGVPQARSDPADVLLQGETVVLQLVGGDDGVVRDHSAVTCVTTPLRHAQHPPHLQTIYWFAPLTFISEAITARFQF